MAPARIAVIGGGMIGMKHINVLTPGTADYALCAIADPAPIGAEIASQRGVPHFANYQEMLDKAKPDGVVAAVPNQLHLEVGLACVARKVPVIMEKPIADSIAAAMQLVEAAAKANVPLLVGHHRRYNPIMRKAAEIVRGGGVGQVVAASAMWLGHKPDDYFSMTWRREPGAGPVLINSIHDVDCLRMMCGDVDTVQAASANAVRGFPVEDTAAAVLRFKSGALATLIVSDTASSPWTWEWTARENPVFPHEWENCFFITGTTGSLAVPSLEHRWHEPGRESWNTPLLQKRIPLAQADPYYEQMRHFTALIAGKEKPVMSGEEGAKTLATTVAINESAKTGMPVKVDDLIKRAA
jgi:predicted dehydrogenase